MNIILDLDGTLCDHSHRSHLIPAPGNKFADEMWELFHRACDGDKPYWPIACMIDSYRTNNPHSDLIISTGRSESARVKTEEWLRKKFAFGYEALLMRPIGSKESASFMKPKMVQEFYGADYNPSNLLVIDNDPRVIRAWNARGANTILVNFDGSIPFDTIHEEHPTLKGFQNVN